MKQFGVVALLIGLVAAPLCAVAGSPKSLEENLQAAGRFSTYLELQKIAAPGKGSGGKSPQTYLVPNDEAFATLPAEALAALKKNPAQARKFLDAHTLPGRLTVNDMVGPARSKSEKIKSVQGFALEFKAPSTEEAATAPPPPTVVTLPSNNITAPPQVVEVAIPTITAPVQTIDLGMIAIEPIMIQAPPPPSTVEQPQLVIMGIEDLGEPPPTTWVVAEQPNLSGGGSAYELMSPLMTYFYLGEP